MSICVQKVKPFKARAYLMQYCGREHPNLDWLDFKDLKGNDCLQNCLSKQALLLITLYAENCELL